MSSEYAVIFDVDGVLVDSYVPHFRSWRRLLTELGVEFTETQFRATFGRTNRDILGELYPGELSDERISELGNRKEAFYREIILADFTPLDGAAELIDSLHAAGFKLAIGSSGPPANIELTLDKLGRRNRFAAMATGHDVTRGKPDPQVFQIAAERLGVPPSRCAVIEDAPAGVDAANRAGMASIAVLGTATREQLGHARLVVNSLRELAPAEIQGIIATASR